MSYQAQNLFGLLYVGGVSRKAVLQACANYADDEMRVFAKNRTLANDTDQSEATARRRLHELEALGLLIRFPQFVDDNGKINKEGRGRRISDEIRLIPTATQAEIDRRAKEIGLRWRKENGEPDDDGDDDAGPVNLQGQRPDSPELIQGTHESGSDEVSPPNLQGPSPLNSDDLQGRPSHCGKGIDESLPESFSPQSPSLAGEADEADQPKEEWEQKTEAEPITFEKFKELYPIEIISLSLTRSLFEAHSEDERRDLVHAARGYRDFCGRNSKRAVMDADKFIRRDKWPGFVETGKQLAPKPRTFVRAGTPTWAGLCMLHAIIGIEPPKAALDATFEAEGAWTTRPGLPPAVITLGSLLDRHGPWVFVEENTPPAWRWKERLNECHFAMPRPQSIGVGPMIPFEWGGKTSMVMKKKNGWLFPTQWPPPKAAAARAEMASEAA